MAKQLDGRVAVITGAGEGIGLEIARTLAHAGAAVVLNDLDPQRTDTAARMIEAEGGRCVGVSGDVADPELNRHLVEQAVERFGRVDLVVANAGITHWCGFLDYEPATFDRVVEVNLRGSFFLAQAGARQMRVQGEGGSILLMSSVVADRAVPRAPVYTMTKAALRALARALVPELSRHRITVNALAPGATLTPRTLGEQQDYEADWQRRTPLGRPATPGDIAAAALFLLSPAARHITGQTLTVDGGWTVADSALPDPEHEQEDPT
jgi:glucose 1-dehydrogenase